MALDPTDVHRAVARLRDALSRPVGEAQLHRGDLALVLAAAEWVDRLGGYVTHREGCGHYQRRPFYSGLDAPGSCSCGLDEVLLGRFPGEPRGDTWAEQQRRRGPVPGASQGGGAR